MSHFKNHNGFSFIEMMVALTLLSIFGTSLFLVQTNIFSKVSKTHQSITNMFELDKHIFKFNQEIQTALQQKKSVDKLTFHHKDKKTDTVINIKIKAMDQNSKLFKEFGKNIRLVQASISHGKQTEVWSNFIYIPPADKKESETPMLKEAL